MSQHTINLPCIADTWLDNGNYTATHGADTALKGGWNYMPSSEIVLRFNYSTLPPRKKATAAMLKIYNLESITPGSYGYIRYNRVQHPIPREQHCQQAIQIISPQAKPQRSAGGGQ